jgi:hypothetical protein
MTRGARTIRRQPETIAKARSPTPLMPDGVIVIERRISPAYRKLIKALEAAAAERLSGDFELKVVVRDGTTKTSFVRQDEQVALNN